MMIRRGLALLGLLGLALVLSLVLRTPGESGQGVGAIPTDFLGSEPSELPLPPLDSEPGLRIDVLDVGQGDAILIRTPGGQTVLYDGGEGRVALVPLLRDLGVTALDLVIASHNHADHIGGLPDVIRTFRPRFVLENGIPNTTRTYERFLEAILEAESALLEPERRQIELGEVTLDILPPAGRVSWGQNDNSLAVFLTYGTFRASFMGDAEARAFRVWLETYPELFTPVALHKGSHHGSRNGDTEEAIRALRPALVVLGVGAGNSYGHPHTEALSHYAGVGAQVLRTDLHGAIVIEVSPEGAVKVMPSRTPEGDPS
jgi:competence protein ComEC